MSPTKHRTMVRIDNNCFLVCDDAHRGFEHCTQRESWDQNGYGSTMPLIHHRWETTGIPKMALGSRTHQTDNPLNAMPKCVEIHQTQIPKDVYWCHQKYHEKVQLADGDVCESICTTLVHGEVDEMARKSNRNTPAPARQRQCWSEHGDWVGGWGTVLDPCCLADRGGAVDHVPDRDQFIDGDKQVVLPTQVGVFQSSGTNFKTWTATSKNERGLR